MKKKKRGCGCGFLIFILIAAAAVGWFVLSSQDDGKSSDRPAQTASPKTMTVSTPHPTANPTPTAKPTEAAVPEEPAAETAEPDSTERDESEIDPDFKAAMDSYEAYFDAYVECMNSMKTDPTNLTVLGHYSELMAQYADMAEKLDAMDDEELTDAELSYYIEVNARIQQKLLTVAE